MSGLFYHGDSTASFVADHFSMALPTALSIQADFNVYKNLFLNATIVKGFAHGTHPGVRAPDIYSLTPRLEKKWFEVSVPFSVLHYNHWQPRGFGIQALGFYRRRCPRKFVNVN
jgi:hypothetical protein